MFEVWVEVFYMMMGRGLELKFEVLVGNVVVIRGFG